MRLIDADALGVTDFELVLCGGDYKELCKMLIAKVESAPVIDAVPVVRCRECQNWETDWEPSNFDSENPRYYCGEMDGFPKGDWYCSQGQRREDGEHENQT